jgi:hypothetical protein
MAGFGGDAKVALLTGLIGGINKRKETQRQIERENILNEQSQQMIAESRARVDNYEATQRRALERQQREAAAAQEATAEAAREAEAEQARLESILPTAMERFGLDEDTARAIVTDPDFDVDQLLPPEEKAMSDLDRARAAQIRTDTEAQRIENLLAKEVSDLAGEGAALKLRRGIETGDQRVVQAAIFELAEGGGYSQEAITEYMDKFQASDNDGKPVPMAEQRKRWGDQGTIYATRLVQEAGNGGVEAAIARVEGAMASLPPDADPSDLVILRAALDALEEMKSSGKGGITAGDLQNR